MNRILVVSRILDAALRVVLSAVLLLAGMPTAALAAPIDFNGTNAYTQNFQSMTSPAAASSVTGSAMTEVSTLNGGTGITGWYIYGLGWNGAANRWIGADSGTSTTGGFRQLIDTASPVNRALGSQGSGSATGFFGVVLKNTSGATINTVALAYDAVMNRNPSSTANPYPLSYRVSSATVTSGSSTGDGTFNNTAGTWTTSAIGFDTPSSGTGAPGTQAAISPLFTIGNKAGNLTGLNWGADQYLYIRWSETDNPGSDATAGIDNFSLTPIAVRNLSWNLAGSGTWDTTTANWTTGSGSTTFLDGDQAAFSNSAGGTITLSGALAPSSVTVSAASGSYTFSGPTAGDKLTGATAINKSGAGALALTSVNDYVGGTNVSGGTLSIDGAGRLGSGAVTISQGATLLSNAGSGFALANDLQIGSGGGRIDTGSQNLSVASMGSLTGLLTKAGAGTLTVNGAFSPGAGGGVAVEAGNLVLGNSATSSGVYNLGASGVLTGNLVLSGTQRMNVNDGAVLSGAGQVQLATSGALISNLSGNSGGTISAGIGLNSTAAPFTAGSWTGATYTPGTFTSTIGATKGANTSTVGGLVVSGVISGASDVDFSNGTVVGGGGGVLTLNAQNTYAGNTTINANTPDVAGTASIVLGIDDAIPTASGVIVGTKAGIGGAILNLNGHSQRLAYLADGVSATVGTTKNLSIVNNGASPSTLTLGGAVTPGKAFGGVIGTGAGTIDLVKTGANTQSLAGTNTYTGSTTIEQGTLALTGAGSLASPSITVASGATFDVSAVTGGYTLSSTQTLGGTGTVSGAATVAGAIAPGSGAIGTLSMGDTTLSGGGGLNFQLYDAAGAAGTGWDLIAAGTLSQAATGSFTIRLASASSAAGAAGSAVNFDANSPGSWEMISAIGLTGFDANRYTVDTSGFANALGGGNFSVSDSGAAGTGLYLVFTPGSIATWDGGNGTWSAAGGGWSTGSWDPTRTAVFASPAGTVTVDGTVNADRGLQFDVGGYTLSGGSLALGGASAAANTITTAADTTTIASSLAAANGFTKAGAGTLLLTGAANGGAQVAAGQLQIGNGGSAGSLAGDVSLAAGTSLVFNRSDAASAGNLTGSGAVRTDGGDLSIASIGENVALTNAGAAVVTVSGAVGGAATVTNSGAGRIALSDVTGSAAITNSGAGRIDLAGPTVSTSGAITASGGTISFGDAGFGSGGVNLSGGGKIAFDGSAPKTLANAITVAASGGGIDVAAGDTLTLGGTVTRNGLLTKGGAGTLSVAALPTTNLAIADGTLDVSATGTVTVASDLAPLFAGGKLSFSGNNVRVNVNAVQTGTGAIELTKGGQSIAVSGASGTLSNTVNLALASGAVNLGATSGYTLTVDGPITGTGDVNLAVGGSGGAGTTILNAASSFAGNVTVNSSATGVHRLGVDNALPTTAGVTFGSTAGQIDLNGHSQQVAFLKGSSAGGGGIQNSQAGTAATLSVIGTTSGTYAGPIGATGKTNIALVKDGTSTLTLSGSSVYSGGTDVRGGTLTVAGPNALGTGDVTLRPGATLDLGSQAATNALANTGGTVVNAANFAGSQVLSGISSFAGTMGGTLDVTAGGVLKGSDTTFTGPVTIQSGAIHSPGNSPGLQTFAAGIDYQPGSFLRWELAANTAAVADRGTSYDGVNVTGGALSIDPTSVLDLVFDATGSTVDWSNAFWNVDRTWSIVDVTGASGSTGLFSLGSLSNDSLGQSLASIRNGAAFRVVGDVGGGVSLSYSVTAVPEPTTVSLGLAALAAVALQGLRRRRA